MRKVFVLGAHRSGTSKLAAYFREVLEFKGYPEGHVYRFLHYMKQGRVEIAKTIPPRAYEINRIGFDFVLQQLTQTIDGLVTAHHGSMYHYVDKTPGYQMILAAQVLQEHLPESLFIHIHRNGIENVNSNMRTWSNRRFKGACEMWSMSIEAFFELEPMVRDRMLKLTQSDIALEPVATHKRIVEFLDLDVDIPDQRLIDYFSQGSKSSKQVFTKELVQRVPTLAEQDWTDAEKKVFEATCGPWMEKLGYPL